MYQTEGHNLYGFLPSFHFSPNPFFTNTVLTKEYKLREDPDTDSPLEYDGPEIIRSVTVNSIRPH
jgi:hypothetical protein